MMSCAISSDLAGRCLCLQAKKRRKDFWEMFLHHLITVHTLVLPYILLRVLCYNTKYST